VQNFVTDEKNTKSAKLVNMSQACHLSDIFSTLNVFKQFFCHYGTYFRHIKCQFSFRS